MKNKQIPDLRLDFPSHLYIVNLRNMKRLLMLSNGLPDEFECKDVTNIPQYSVNNYTAIKRILFYLFYLGILKLIKTQDGNKFKFTSTGEELRRIVINQPEKFSEKWSEAIKKSELYSFLISTQEFQKWGFISKSGLKELIKDSFSARVKDREERSDKALQFLIQLLEDAKLFYFDGNCLRPMNHGIKREPIEEFYNAKTDDYELKVRYNENAFELLQMQIDIAKKKFESIQKIKEEGQKK